MDLDQVMDAASRELEDVVDGFSSFVRAVDRVGFCVSDACVQGPQPPAIRRAIRKDMLKAADESPVAWDKIEGTEEKMAQIQLQVEQCDPERRASVESTRRYLTQIRKVCLVHRSMVQKFSTVASDIQAKLDPRAWPPATLPEILSPTIPQIDFAELEFFEADVNEFIADLDMELELLECPAPE